jgi:hypothetical protein
MTRLVGCALINPLESALATCLPSVQQNAPVSPLFATLMKAPGVYPCSSHSGTHHSPPTTVPFALSFHALMNCPFSISFLLTFMHRMGGVGGAFQFSLPASNLQHLTSAFSHSSALFCTFSYSPKIQLSCFHAIPNSLRKTPGVGGTPSIARFAAWGHESLVASIGFPMTHPIESPRRTTKRACTLRNEAMA